MAFDKHNDKVSKSFYIHEFVPKVVFDHPTRDPRWYIRPEVIQLAQYYRDYFGRPVYINNWYWGGDKYNRGFRTRFSQVGANWSQHRLGCAFDCNIKGLSPDEVRAEILANQSLFMSMGLTTIESGDYAPTWIHSDIRPTHLDYILIVKP